ncbi:MAG: hypothetical protein NC301_05920 [Bacteroides sp.]|nr:hypothetical protein [Bacteroides sp.]MCM1379849.1 hypothetical protein [Bacteroides sp.]MCM1446119.1 hypothetical protein [Prevotella sp.]
MTKRLLPILCLFLLCACGGEKSFKVNVDVPAVGTQEMTVVYGVGGGERVVMRLPAIDGKFEFKGQSADTTSVEIYNAKKLLVACFLAVNGMELELKLACDSLFIEDSLDKVITSLSDTSKMDYGLFPAKVSILVRQDSTARFSPRGLWFFTASIPERSHAVIDSMRKYAKLDTIPVRDVYVSPDMSQWRLSTARDSATWTQGIMPDAPLALKDVVVSTPCMVEVDTAGVVRRVYNFR